MADEKQIIAGKEIPLGGYVPEGSLKIPVTQKVFVTNPLAYPEVGTVRSTTSTAATIYTTPAETDFYLSQVVISATMTGGAGSPFHVEGITGIKAFVSGIQTIIGSVSLSANLYSPDGGASLLSTSKDKDFSIQFRNPVKIDRNTAITTAVISGTAPSSFLAVIYGFNAINIT